MGKRIRMSSGRRLVDDIIQIANKMPLASFAGDFDTGNVGKFRRSTRPKVAWNVLYMKAYATVCAENPTLRRSYVRFPWGHYYQHDATVCMMTVAREYEGEERLFFARFNEPDRRSLADLQELYDHYRQAPVEEIKQFRHQILFSKFPKLLRRFAWWTLFHVWPQKRASHMGTFGISISGYKGAFGNQHLGPATTVLGVDPFPRNNIAHLVLTFDHQVIDGAPVTKALQRTHQFLNTSIKTELAEMIGVHPSTGEPLTDEELAEIKKAKRARRVETNRKRHAA